MQQRLDPTEPFAYGRFDGRRAVITGGTQGLGLATARLMKARGAQAIVVVGRTASKGQAAVAELDGDGCAAHFIEADLGTDDGLATIADGVAERIGAPHAFVNCAAATWRGTVYNTTPEMWDSMLGINVKAPGVLVSAIARAMRAEGIEGSMVLISSIAHHGAAPVLYPYAASKHALEALVRNAAFSLMPERIRVNMLNPGWMDTPAEHEVQQRFHDAPDDWLDAAEAAAPFGRLLKPEEAARGICFLASDESGMMTGASVDFDQSIPGAGDLPRPESVPLHFPWED